MPRRGKVAARSRSHQSGTAGKRSLPFREPVVIAHPNILPRVYERDDVIRRVESGDLQRFNITKDNYRDYLLTDHFTAAFVAYLGRKNSGVIRLNNGFTLTDILREINYTDPISLGVPEGGDTVFIVPEGRLYEGKSVSNLVKGDGVIKSPFNPSRKIRYPGWELIEHPLYRALQSWCEANSNASRINLYKIFEDLDWSELLIYQNSAIDNKIFSPTYPIIEKTLALPLTIIQMSALLPNYVWWDLNIVNVFTMALYFYVSYSSFEALVHAKAKDLFLCFKDTEFFIPSIFIHGLIPLAILKIHLGYKLIISKDTSSSLLGSLHSLCNVTFLMYTELSYTLKTARQYYQVTQLSSLNKAFYIAMVNIAFLSLFIVAFSALNNIYEKNSADFPVLDFNKLYCLVPFIELLFMSLPFAGFVKQLQDGLQQGLPDTQSVSTWALKFVLAGWIGGINYYSGSSGLNVLAVMTTVFMQSFCDVAVDKIFFPQRPGIKFLSQLFVLPREDASSVAVSGDVAGVDLSQPG